jgi:hypothetical protein
VNAKLVEDIANAVLYEGYMLYPYRPSSVKNRQRWNFGVVYPKAGNEMQNGSDNSYMQTECLVKGSCSTDLSVKVRFLQAVARTIGELESPMDVIPPSDRNGLELKFHVVPSLQTGTQIYQAWQEAIEREIILPSVSFVDSGSAHCTQVLIFPGGREMEPIRGVDGRIIGLIFRTKEAIAAKIDLALICVTDGCFKITVRISNVTRNEDSESSNRESVLTQSLLSTHTVLRVNGGEFVSLIDPPDELKEIVAKCNNVGTWPVLAGEEGDRDGMLSSPIILYDYPQIAPESPGDLYDGTEIDEILALRILTLTDEEKYEMRHADERARQILERTETMPAEHFMKLHGVLRGMHVSDEEKP